MRSVPGFFHALFLQVHMWEKGFFIITRLKRSKQRRKRLMAFFNSAVGVLQTLVIALGAGLGIWGAINLLEGYGNDNPGANAHVR